MECWPRQTTCSEAGNCQWMTTPVYTASAASAVNVAHFPVSQGRALALCLLLGKGRAKRVAICHVHGPDLPHLCTPSSLLSLEQTLRYLRCYWSTWSLALYNRSWWCRDFPDAGQPHSHRTDDSGHANESCGRCIGWLPEAVAFHVQASKGEQVWPNCRMAKHSLDGTISSSSSPSEAG